MILKGFQLFSVMEFDDRTEYSFWQKTNLNTNCEGITVRYEVLSRRTEGNINTRSPNHSRNRAIFLHAVF